LLLLLVKSSDGGKRFFPQTLWNVLYDKNPSPWDLQIFANLIKSFIVSHPNKKAKQAEKIFRLLRRVYSIYIAGSDQGLLKTHLHPFKFHETRDQYMSS